MKLNHIAIENFQILRTLSLDLSGAPVCLVAGKNEQGKSSLLDAVRLALTGEAARVKLKKDYPALVRDGTKNGKITVESTEGTFSVTLPSGKRNVEASSAALPFLLDSTRFAAMPENERRSFMLALTGQSCNIKVVNEKLADRGCAPDKIEAILPLLHSGFPAAEKEAKSRATEAKGAWRAVTGETYGPQKAETWAPTSADKVPAEQVDAAKTAVNAAKDAVSALEQEYGAAHAIRDAAAGRVARMASLGDKAQQYARAADLVNRAQKDLDEFLPQVEALRRKATVAPLPAPRACPHCSANIYEIGGNLVAHPEQEYDPDAVARLPDYEKSLKVLENALASRKRELEDADTAAKQLAALREETSTPLSDADYAALKTRLDEKKDLLRTLSADLDGLQEQNRKAAQADEDAAKAAQHHADVQAWEKIADALAPDGIPGESMDAARNVFNARLRETAGRTGWAQVSVDADISVRIDGRLYALCSESARWRADAALTEAVSFISGLRLFAIDRIDVLDGENRLACLKWLHVLAKSGEIESAIVTGTFKVPPSAPATFAVHWLEHGEIIEHREAA